MKDRSRVPLVIAAVLLLVVSPAFAGSWRVGPDQTACPGGCNFFGATGIQDAMVNLSVLPGDTVTVWPGTYGGGTTINLKSGIFLRSADGPENTMIVGGAGASPAIFIVGAQAGTIVEGFTLTWDADLNSLGGGIAAYVSDGIIRNNWFVSNQASVGSGLYLQACGMLVQNNLFLTNQTNAGGGAVAVSGGTPTIRNNTFTGNYSPFGYDGSSFYVTGATFVFDRNVVEGSLGSPAMFCGGGNTPSVSCNIFWNNELGAFAGQCSDSVGTSGNIAADPLFCSPGTNFGMCSDSPAFNGPCGTIGYAWPGGNCAACRPTAVAASFDAMPWGRVKALYR